MQQARVLVALCALFSVAFLGLAHKAGAATVVSVPLYRTENTQVIPAISGCLTVPAGDETAWLVQCGMVDLRPAGEDNVAASVAGTCYSLLRDLSVYPDGNTSQLPTSAPLLGAEVNMSTNATRDASIDGIVGLASLAPVRGVFLEFVGFPSTASAEDRITGIVSSFERVVSLRSTTNTTENLVGGVYWADGITNPCAAGGVYASADEASSLRARLVAIDGLTPVLAAAWATPSTSEGEDFCFFDASAQVMGLKAEPSDTGAALFCNSASTSGVSFWSLGGTEFDTLSGVSANTVYRAQNLGPSVTSVQLESLADNSTASEASAACVIRPSSIFNTYSAVECGMLGVAADRASCQAALRALSGDRQPDAVPIASNFELPSTPLTVVTYPAGLTQPDINVDGRPAAGLPRNVESMTIVSEMALMNVSLATTVEGLSQQLGEGIDQILILAPSVASTVAFRFVGGDGDTLDLDGIAEAIGYYAGVYSAGSGDPVRINVYVPQPSVDCAAGGLLGATVELGSLAAACGLESTVCQLWTDETGEAAGPACGFSDPAYVSQAVTTIPVAPTCSAISGLPDLSSGYRAGSSVVVEAQVPNLAAVLTGISVGLGTAESSVSGPNATCLEDSGYRLVLAGQVDCSGAGTSGVSCSVPAGLGAVVGEAVNASLLASVLFSVNAEAGADAANATAAALYTAMERSLPTRRVASFVLDIAGSTWAANDTTGNGQWATDFTGELARLLAAEDSVFGETVLGISGSQSQCSQRFDAGSAPFSGLSVPPLLFWYASEDDFAFPWLTDSVSVCGLEAGPTNTIKFFSAADVAETCGAADVSNILRVETALVETQTSSVDQVPNESPSAGNNPSNTGGGDGAGVAGSSVWIVALGAVLLLGQLF